MAEPQSIIRLDLTETLQAHGYEVVAVASSLAEAVTLTLFLQPDLLVLDCALITAADDDPIDRIQRTEFPLAVLETCYSSALIFRRQRTGRRVCLPKPFAEEDLIRAAEHALIPPDGPRGNSHPHRTATATGSPGGPPHESLLQNPRWSAMRRGRGR